MSIEDLERDNFMSAAKTRANTESSITVLAERQEMVAEGND